MRVLVTGSRGLLGAAIVREFERDCDVHALDRARLDLTDERAILAAVDAVRPDVIVNCAAYNDVDGAEDHALDALGVNAFGVLALSRAARSSGAILVHYGSDFVFDGQTDRPYVETDPPRPVSIYGASKLLGEWFGLEAPGGYVLRVESLFGHPATASTRRGSLGGLVDRIRKGDEVGVFVDRTVSPGYTVDVAAATRQIVARRPAPGLYHCVNRGAISWADIATELARLLDRPLRLKPITLETASLRARRPRFSALSVDKLDSVGIHMPDWRDALTRFVDGESRSEVKEG
jgi:dTDP-4-dehydrorhamnose reductase